MECEYCNQTFKTKYILKSHYLNSKTCLKIRGLELESKFICICKMNFSSNINLEIHYKSCKDYCIMKATEKMTEEIKNLKENLEEKEAYIKKLTDELKNKELIYTKIEVKYDDLYKNNEELKQQHEKMINKLEMKIYQCDSFIQTLARDGSNKVTTTNNVTVRNQLSPTFTLDSLESKKLEETMREYYTERDFFGGQKRLANFFMEKVIKTPDDKMLICCTDTSRKKFKILDVRGNLKEDIEARTLCDKLKVPTQMVTKEIYDKVIDKIDKERDRLNTDDRSKREKLLDDSMRAQKYYMEILNFDDLNYNQDFMHELCVLLNV